MGARYGWRALFAVGGAPALLVAFIRRGVHEPERWRQVEGRQSARAAFSALFGREYRKRTLVNALLLLVARIGLLAGSVYVPGAVTQIATRAGYGAADAARLASWATMLLSAGNKIGRGSVFP